MEKELIWITNIDACKKSIYQEAADICSVDIFFGPAKCFENTSASQLSVWARNKDNAEVLAEASVKIERKIIQFFKSIGLKEYEVEQSGMLAIYMDQTNPDGFKISDELDRELRLYEMDYENKRFP